MRRTICFLLIIAICLSVLLTSCEDKGNEDQVKDREYPNMFPEYTTDDSKTLEESLTVEYSLAELLSFFDGANYNELSELRENPFKLTYDQINEHYPIEVFRSRGYSAYKVKEGGYFYVFWMKSYNIEYTVYRPAVYFSTYISAPHDSSAFDSIVAGRSTAKDVKNIDGFFELIFMLSHATYSWSYLNDDTLLQIEYTCKDDISTYEDLIVKEKKIVSRTQSASCGYALIMPQDLP